MSVSCERFEILMEVQISFFHSFAALHGQQFAAISLTAFVMILVYNFFNERKKTETVMPKNGQHKRYLIGPLMRKNALKQSFRQ